MGNSWCATRPWWCALGAACSTSDEAQNFALFFTNLSNHMPSPSRSRSNQRLDETILVSTTSQRGCPRDWKTNPHAQPLVEAWVGLQERIKSCKTFTERMFAMALEQKEIHVKDTDSQGASRVVVCGWSTIHVGDPTHAHEPPRVARLGQRSLAISRTHWSFRTVPQSRKLGLFSVTSQPASGELMAWLIEESDANNASALLSMVGNHKCEDLSWFTRDHLGNCVGSDHLGSTAGLTKRWNGLRWRRLLFGPLHRRRAWPQKPAPNPSRDCHSLRGMERRLPRKQQ